MRLRKLHSCSFYFKWQWEPGCNSSDRRFSGKCLVYYLGRCPEILPLNELPSWHKKGVYCYSSFLGYTWVSNELPITFQQQTYSFTMKYSKMSFIGVTYDDHRVYIAKPATWDEMLDKAIQLFRLVNGQVLRVLYRPDINDQTSPL